MIVEGINKWRSLENQSIYSYYGHENQMDKLIEELLELATAAKELKRAYSDPEAFTSVNDDDSIMKKSISSFIDETADVLVLLDQIVNNHHYDFQVKDKIIHKINRQVNRIKALHPYE